MLLNDLCGDAVRLHSEDVVDATDVTMLRLDESAGGRSRAGASSSTGHTGFKPGSWLECLWLSELGAQVSPIASGRRRRPVLTTSAKRARAGHVDLDRQCWQRRRVRDRC